MHACKNDQEEKAGACLEKEDTKGTLRHFTIGKNTNYNMTLVHSNAIKPKVILNTVP